MTKRKALITGITGQDGYYSRKDWPDGRPFWRGRRGHANRANKRQESVGGSMPNVLEIQQGIWIDEQLLRRAGVGAQCQVVVQPGEIRIIPLAVSSESPSLEGEQSNATDVAWHVFRSLGRNAPPGKLPNTSTDHDRYLYGNKR